MRLVYQTFDFCCAVRPVFTQTPHPQQIFGQVALNYEAMALQRCRIGSPIFTKVPAGLCWSLKSRLNDSTWSDSAWKSWLSRFLRWGCEVPVAKSRVKFRRASLPLSWSSTTGSTSEPKRLWKQFCHAWCKWDSAPKRDQFWWAGGNFHVYGIGDKITSPGWQMVLRCAKS